MKINTTFSSDKVPTRTKWLYPLSGIGRDMAYTLVSLFLMTFIQYTMDDVGGYDNKMLAFTIFLVLYRVWDGINDPMMGTIIENSRFKMGKYKPWILIGAIFNSIFLVLLFSVRLSGWWYVAFIGVVYFLWEISFTMNDIAYWSLLPSLTSESKQRGQITTLVSVFAAIGAFISGGLIPFLSGRFGLIELYRFFSIIVAVTFLICQLVLVFFTQERERPQIVEEEKQTLGDMFKVIWHNKQLWVMMIAVTLYYLGSALLNAFGLNYFYFAYGFKTGADNMTLFTIIYALSSVLSQMCFPFLQKKMRQNTILALSFYIMTIGYALFFVMGLIPAVNGTAPNLLAMLILGFFIFAGQGIFYMELLIMMTNTIEYNEWTTGKRNESIIFAARPFAAKVSSSLQTLLVYVVLLVGGVYSVTQQISSIQIEGARENWTSEAIVNASNNLITNSPNRQMGTIAILFGMAIIPIILYGIAYLYMKRRYRINEENYQRMVADINQGKFSKENKL
ncbi:MAG TPA: glycoside-pentoside-hexuronide (GPH):cation symporter [Bacilli bacterium]|nr:glycoside-pentoside-hexuronide (GPH):cation symporter [Bacilli bacterium]